MQPLIQTIILGILGTAIGTAGAMEPCRIEIVEEGSGWPIPLVELRTTHQVAFISDNAGVIAFDLPELMGQETWFDVRGNGYERARDGFGYRGVRLTPEPGKTLRVELTRTLVARRLGRLTGAGLYAESQKTGQDLAWPETGVLGCDSVQTAVYRDRRFWLWGDTTLAPYPLGIFDSTAATTPLHPLAGFEPPLRMAFDYFRDDAGRPQGVAKMPGPGPTWLTAMVTLPDRHGQPHLVATYAKIQGYLEAYEWGLCRWDDQQERFDRLRVLWRKSDATPTPPAHPEGHPVTWADAEGGAWVLFGNPFPRLRCPATFEAWQDPVTWEILTPQATVLAADTDYPVKPHTGSIAWNAWRSRWVTVFMEAGGKPSALGELWYAEADAPTGPWGPAVKVLSHENYTFYNPRLHPGLTPDDSPILLFEGTYTAEFADRPTPTPRYNYNQVLYGLDLDDPALAPAQRFAAPPGDTALDLQHFIDAAIRSGTTRIVVPPGRYRVVPRNRQHLVLQDLTDIQIIADDVEVVCTETTRALTITRCTNLTVRGLTIEYDPLPFTQGRIVGFGEGKRVHEIELFDGYPDAASAVAFKYEVFRPDTRTLRGDDHYPERVEAVGKRRLRVHLPGGRASDPESVGDLIVIGAEHAPNGSIPHAVECSHNVNLCLQDIELFASNCFGFLEWNCDRSLYRECRIDRRAPHQDPVVRASPRLRSLNADAFHSKHARTGPAYVDCTARFMGDDGININGDYHLVMASTGRTLRVLAKHDMNIRVGDTVELVEYSGRRLPDARVSAINDAGAIREDERAFLLDQRMNEDLRQARGALTHASAITLDRKVNLARGGLIGSTDRMGNGFRVEGCTVGFNRSRGILIKASHGEVRSNRIEGTRMAAILVSPEFWWLEAGSSRNVQIVDNAIRDCGGIPICIEATGGDGAIAPAGAHQDIVVTGNTITRSRMPGILITSTSGLRVEDNTLELEEGRPLSARLQRADGSVLQPLMVLRSEP